MSDRRYVKSVQRALSLLEALIQGGEQGLSSLGVELGLQRSSVHRLLKTLEACDFVQQSPVNRKYALSARARRLCYYALGHVDLRQYALPFLQELQRASGENVSLAVLEGDQVVYVERLGSQQLLSINIGVGARLSPHCTAAGKVLLAYLPRVETRARVRAMDLQRFTDRTLTDPDRLLEVLEQVAERGYAECDGEIAEGVSSVAAPVRDYTSRVVAAINVVGASFRFTGPVRQQVLPLLLRAVAAVSAALGCEPEGDGARKASASAPGSTRLQ